MALMDSIGHVTCDLDGFNRAYTCWLNGFNRACHLWPRWVQQGMSPVILVGSRGHVPFGINGFNRACPLWP